MLFVDTSANLTRDRVSARIAAGGRAPLEAGRHWRPGAAGIRGITGRRVVAGKAEKRVQGSQVPYATVRKSSVR
ncbi:hypothetical protein GCM10009660_50790 [Catellatospora bangladeshensis]